MPSYHAQKIERSWQAYWETNETFRTRDLVPGKPKLYVLDMFPYPSGAGLHVGHPEGYTATDIVCRYKRMRGFNVLHPMGWDAFGLPAEQYAVKENIHPSITTQRNVDNFRRQIKSLGFSYDWSREVDTTDPGYYKWTQWIFLQIYDTWYDPEFEWVDGQGRPHKGKGRPIAELPIPAGETDPDAYRDARRLAYRAEIPVNWCPELGTVLANEEVIDGKSERGGYPVVRMPLKQWMLRITAYADRLVSDLEGVDWTRAIKDMQRNWVGRSEGAEVEFRVGDGPDSIRVFTTRPDTLFGATYMVLAPEHPLVDRLTTAEHRAAVAAYREAAARKSDLDRTELAKTKTGVATGATAINPVTGTPIPVWIADYVLMGYGTGAIMAVPGHDERDFEFAKTFGLPITAVVMAQDDWLMANNRSRLGDFEAEQTMKAQAEQFGFDFIDLYEIETPAQIVELVPESFARENVVIPLMQQGGKIKVVFHDPMDFDTIDKLRFVLNREIEVALAPKEAILQAIGRFYGTETAIERVRSVYLRHPERFAEPFTGLGTAVNSHNAEISLDGLPTAEAKAKITAWLEAKGAGKKAVNTKLRDWLFSRQRYWGEPFPILLDADDRALAVPEAELPVLLPELADFKPSGKPEPPLGKATEWVRYSETARREINTMPQWAGSCWYYLRYLDPKNAERPWDPELEKYWMPVDLYVGGAEHAVLHLLYSRFWHKVLFDRGLVSTPEPFGKLVNQGMILGEVEYTGYQDEAGAWHPSSEVQELEGGGYQAGKAGPAVQPVKLDADDVVKQGDSFVRSAAPQVRVEARAHKMSKSRGNVISPDRVVEEYGADSLRLYEMFMGPLEAVKPWSMKGVEGVYRFLARSWRLIVDDRSEDLQLDPRVQDVPPSPEQAKLVARTVAAVTDDYERMSFNTAISRLMEFANAFTSAEVRPRAAMEAFVLLLAPMAPHIAEELWKALGKGGTLAYEPWPTFDPKLLVDDEVEVPVQVNGKVRGRVVVPAGADAATLEAAARADEKLAVLLEGKTVRKVVAVPGKLVNFVVG